MSDPAQVTPNGTAFVGFPWTSEEIELPTNYTILNEDGSTTVGDPIDWSAVVVTARSRGDELTFTVTFNAATRVAVIGLSADQIVISIRSFRWYLVASNFPNAPLMWQRVDVGRLY